MNVEEANKYKALGNKAFQEQKFEEAIDHFTKAIQHNPNDHVFYSNRSGAYASLNKYEEALQDAEKCIEIKKDWSKGYQRKGLALFYLQKYNDSKAAYQEGLKIDPNNEQLKEGLQRATQEEDNSSGAGSGKDNFVNQLMVKLMMNPKTAAYMQDPGFVSKLQILQKNPQMFSTLMQTDPRLQEALNVMLGDMMGGAGGQNFGQFNDEDKEEKPHKHDESHSHHDHSHDHSHDHDKKHEHHEKKEEESKSHSHSSHSHHSNAQKEQQHKEQHLDEAEKLKNQGNEHYKKREFDKALELYDQAIRLKPSELLYYNNKAACYLEKGQFDEALSQVDKALEISDTENLKDFSKLAKLYARKGAILEKKGQLKEAIDWLEKSLLEDHQEKVKNDLKRLQKLFKEQLDKAYVDPNLANEANEKAKQLFQDGKFPEAMKLYDEAIKRDPTNPKFYCNRGICYIKLMAFPSALSDFEKTIQLDPNYVKAYAKKGNVHYLMKEYHKSIETYKKGLAIDQNNEECKQGLTKTQTEIYAGNETPEERQKRAEKAMSDPEIQHIMINPEVQNALKDMSSNPGAFQKVMQNPNLAPKIQKLIEAGVVGIR